MRATVRRDWPGTAWRILGAGVAIVLSTSACHHETAAPAQPASLEAPVAAISGVVGTALAPAPSFVVKDASGRTLGGIPIVITISDGGGTIRNAPARTAGNGATSVGQWTLGTRAGRNAVTVTSGSLPPLTIEASGVAGPPVALVLGDGDGQSGFAGGQLAQTINAKVLDQFGNGVSGVPVSFAVSRGGGTLTASSARSDAAGIAGSINWTLGKGGGDQEVSASAQLGQVPASVKFFARIQSDFDVTLRFFGPPASTDIAASFTNASNRIHGLITGDIPDIALTNFDVGRCGVAGAVLNEIVDDVVIYATVDTIDGPGKILGSAGPCIIRTSSRLAVIGVMRFDVADLNNLAASGRLEAVILHEMLHIVGVGTVWRSKNLIEASGTPDPRYNGPLATGRCNNSNGLPVCGPSVPIENTGGQGTAEAHWREATFDSELMTGFVEAAGIPMPLSLITAASLEDYGYSVNYLAADPYAVPSLSARLRALPADPVARAPWETFELPLFEVTPSGWVRPLRLN